MTKSQESLVLSLIRGLHFKLDKLTQESEAHRKLVNQRLGAMQLKNNKLQNENKKLHKLIADLA